MPTLTLAQAEELVTDTLARCRTEPGNARSVARALVAAEAEGLKGHGLSRVPTYAAQAKVGKVDGFAKPALTWPRPAVAAIDANNGFAYPALDAAVAALPEADAPPTELLPRRFAARIIAARPVIRLSDWRKPGWSP